MTPDAVRQLVHGQIKERWDTSNAHGIDLRRCLVDPVLVKMDHQRPVGEGIPALREIIDVWVVLEEYPGDRDGYKIVYDETNGMFGLAITGEGEVRPFYLGAYGDFVTALQAM
jgi:hypothetical protein